MWSAVRDGNLAEIKELLKTSPGIDVNWANQSINGWTPLHCAIDHHHDSAVTLLLRHPNIDVNRKDILGSTPFATACFNGNLSGARLLLADPRVSPNEPNSAGNTPLWWAAYFGFADLVRWWIASGRELDLGQPGSDRSDAVVRAVRAKFSDLAEEGRRARLAQLLEGFRYHSQKTRHEVRVEVGWYEEQAALVFAPVVFLSDGLLQVGGAGGSPAAARFFRIAARLPVELQMVLCQRVVGSGRTNILGARTEAAFRSLAERCQALDE